MVPAIDTIASAAPKTQVSIDSGSVTGSVRSDIRSWLGIPYAAAPVGPLRWKPPQPPAPWNTPRRTDSFGASCAQDDSAGTFAAASLIEDCLNLNVYAPRITPARGAPVMVWIFGGSFRNGSASDYDPAALVRQGAVVVTINYRLGILGFFSNPAMGTDQEFGNFGLLDQIFALKWVKRNIAAFGGDPKRVTIFGESSGARSVAVLLASPPARGLFSGAILESLYYDGTKIPNSDGIALGRRFAAAAGCRPDDATCLRSLSVKEVLDAQRRAPPAIAFAPAFGGPEYPVPLAMARRSGNYSRVPVIIGWNHDEATSKGAALETSSGKRATEADYVRVIHEYARRGGGNVEANVTAIAAAYPLSAYPVPALAIARLESDALYVCGARQFLRDLNGQSPTWSYQFDVRDAPMYLPSVSFPLGATHGSELQFLFEGFHGATGKQYPLSPAQGRLAVEMQRLWVNFAASGNPNGRNSVSPWPRAGTTGSPLLLFTTPVATPLGDAYADRHCDLWDRLSENR
jgi:para-nitrobenzyl esterase